MRRQLDLIDRIIKSDVVYTLDTVARGIIEWLAHSFEIAKEVAYILPTNKVFQRQVIMKMINAWGGVKGLIVYGSGSMVGVPFGFSVGTFHFSKGYRGKCALRLGYE